MKHIDFLKMPVLVFSFFILVVPMYGQNADTCYKVNKVADKVWAIVENNTVNIYLVEGKDSALIIDTGYGTGDLKSFVKTLTKLPIIVVNTHGHGDHTGSDLQFSKIYAHSDDFGMIKGNMDKKKRQFTKKKLIDRKDKAPTLIPVKDGYIFDLGNRKLEVIEVPGHTHGSICLLDAGNKILFAGDNTNGLVWLFLKDCYPLEVYLKSLQKVEKRKEAFDIIMPGHNTPLQKTFIDEQIGCVKSILEGSCSPVPYNYASFTKGAMLCKYQTAQVAYDPTNLYEKK
jgi:hydroxyacylglutathione hydrolase